MTWLAVLLPDGDDFELVAPRGHYLVTIGRHDGVGVALRMADAEREALEVVLPGLGAGPDTLFGTVLAPDGRRADGVFLRFHDEGTGVVVQARDRASGTYAAILPPGTYRVRAGWPHPRLGLRATYDLGRIRGTRRWDVQLAKLQTSVVEPNRTAPGVATLAQNYPNPFNASTVIELYLPQRTETRVTVHNILGQPLRELVRGELPGGRHRVVWDARDARRRRAASGVYFCVLEADASRSIRRMLLLR
jgi:hypothetical protein